MKENNRNVQFQKNQNLEEYLKEINMDLAPSEKKILNKEKKEYPVIFVLGPLRSGTTLTLQWLASTGEIAYPTNMLSRFYETPIIGAKIQRLLTDPKFNFRNEILDFNQKVEFISENGKTKGALSPNEFWYFWRHFLPLKDTDYCTDKELLKNGETFKKELLGIADVFEKTFALKAMICNYNIEFLNQMFDKALFIYTKRNPISNIEAALKARERQFGNIDTWYSFEIPEYEQLMKIKDPVKQVAGQVYCINRAVESGLEKIPSEKKVILPYEEFCECPQKYYDEIVEKLSKQGYEMNRNYVGEKRFEATRKNIINAEIEEAYKEYIREFQR